METPGYGSNWSSRVVNTAKPYNHKFWIPEPVAPSTEHLDEARARGLRFAAELRELRTSTKKDTK